MNEKAKKNRKIAKLGCLIGSLTILIYCVSVVYQITRPVGETIFSYGSRQAVMADHSILKIEYDNTREITLFYPYENRYSKYLVDKEVAFVLFYDEVDKVVIFQEYGTPEIFKVTLTSSDDGILISELIGNGKPFVNNAHRSLPVTGSDRLYSLLDYENERFEIAPYYSVRSGFMPLETDWSSSEKNSGNESSAAISPDEKYLTVVKNNQRLLRETSNGGEWVTLPGEDHRVARFIDVDNLFYVTYQWAYWYSISENKVLQKYRFDYSQGQYDNIGILVHDEKPYIAINRMRQDVDVYSFDLSERELLKTFNYFPPEYGDIQYFRLYGDELFVKHIAGIVRKYDFPF